MYPFQGKGVAMPRDEGMPGSDAAEQTPDYVYAVRRSSRARRVTLRYTALEGLVIIIPQAFDISRVPDIVSRKREWIARVADQFRNRAEHYACEPELPEVVMLRAAGRKVSIEYAPSPRPFSIRDNGDSLLISGRYESAKVQKFLREWLKRQASAYLVPLMRELAAEQGVTLSAVRVRLQRSRWGSCSVGNAINLNARLMLLPEPMARYVCLHELAHCKHHNHSKDFWLHLDSLMPDARRVDAALAGAWQFVPGWAYA